MRVEKFESLRGQLKRLPEPPPQPRIARDDLRGALGIFLLAFGSIFPLVIPFIFMSDAKLALRVSNGIAILLLFLAGYALGRYASRHPLRVGLAMVGVAIALGGKAETKIDGIVGDVVASGHRGIGTDRATQAWAFNLTTDGLCFRMDTSPQPSRRTGNGSTSEHATITRSCEPGRYGPATTSPLAGKWSQV
jgi:hypothetical protein